jgi:transposase
MYITVTKKKYKDTYHKQILLRESYREDGKVKSRTIANLTNQPKEQVEAMIVALQNSRNSDELLVSTKKQKQGFSVGFSLIIIFIMKLLGIFKALGKSYNAKIAMVLIASRIVIQSSRIQALYWSKNEDKILDLLNFSKEERDKLDRKTIYYGLDFLEENKVKIEDKLFRSFYRQAKPKRVFYDVTSSYVEGEYSNSELAEYGYNRDKKKGKKQIVIGLLTDENGHAISIDTYKGNTNDVKTFTNQLDKLKDRFKLENITIVGDGGMIKNDDILKIKELGYDYITSIGKPSIRKLIEDNTSKIDMTLFDEDLKEIIEDKTRYILRCNPIRRDEIRKTRESKIAKLREFVKVQAEYYNTHYKAKSKTVTNKIDKKIASLKLKKFISYTTTYKDGDCQTKNRDGNIIIKSKALLTIEIIENKEAKATVEELDGCYIVKTSLINSSKESKEDIHQAYKTLIKVENAFKTLKTDFLEIRPLYLKSDKRIRGHVFLSMLAYNIVLKLKGYIELSSLDFKSTIRELSAVKTVINQLITDFTFETIPNVNDNLKSLFECMSFKLPSRI